MRSWHFLNIENECYKSAQKTNNYSLLTSGCRKINGEDYDYLRKTACRMFGAKSLISQAERDFLYQ